MPHAVQLGNGDVGFIDEEHVVAGKVVQQGGRWLARKPAGKVARVVLDAVAIADGLDHLQIEAGALMDALRLDEAALRFKIFLPPRQLVENRSDGGSTALRLHYVVRLRVDGQARVLLPDGAEEGIDLREGIDLVAEEFDAVGVFVVGWIDLDDVAANAKGAAAEVGIISFVENFDEALGDVFAADLLTFFQQQQHSEVGLRRAEAVDATHRGDDDGVAALEERAGR